jgi:lipopolysaccharide export system protein LptA
MNADQRRRIVKFFGDVEVVHMAAPSPDVPINTDRMPPGAMLMHSDTLEVYSPGEAGSTGAPGSSGSQIMIAKDHATVEMDLFYGRADEIRYTEDQSQVILVGTPANPAEIRHIKFPGAEPDMLSAERFTYNRKTNQYTGYHVKNLSGR